MDLTAVILAFIAAIPPTLAALGALMVGRRTKKGVEQLHIEVDGRLTELLRTTAGEATAAGELAGAAGERERAKER